jgi:beta-lactamase regulating signal transducer with metallopeptidase domain
MSDTVTSLAQSLIDYLLVASLVATGAVLLALGIVKTARIRAPIHRHLIWLWTLAVIVVLPGAWRYGPTWKLAVLPMPAEPAARQVSSQPHPLGAVETGGPVPNTAFSENPAPAAVPRRREPAARIPSALVLAGLWLTGVALMGIRLVLAWRRLRRIVAAAGPAPQARALVKIDHPNVLVLASPDVAGPLCFGSLRPVILLPQRTVVTGSPRELEMILVHELAHVERHDNLVNLFQRLVETVLFFHPLAWYASHQLAREREQICDNHVLARHFRAVDYADLLTRLADQKRARMCLQMLALCEGKLLARVRTLLDPAHDTRTKPARPVAAVGLALLSLCAAGGAIRLEAAGTGSTGPYETVTVYVTDAAGSAVADAQVEVLADYRAAAHGRTDRGGHTTLRVPADANVNWVLALKAGAGLDYYENYTSFPYRLRGELPDPVHLVLGGVRPLRIKAVNGTEKPVAGVTFVPWTIMLKDKRWHVNLSGSEIARGVSNRNGTAVFDWFPAGVSDDMADSDPRPGTALLVQDGEYYWPQYLNKPYRQYEPEVVARLLRNGTISGRVLRPDGRGAAGITVRVEGRGNTPYFCRRATQTAADGSYRLSVYSRQIYMITVENEKWAAQTRSGVVVGEGESVENVDLDLVEGTEVTGRVALDATDEPAPGQLVFLSEDGPTLPVEFDNEVYFGSYSPKQTLIRTTRTDRQGRYAFRVGPGQYTLGTLGMVAHARGDQAVKLVITQEGRIVRNLPTKPPAGIGAPCVGLVFAHQDQIYDGTMVVDSCDYCHMPVRARAWPPASEVPTE